MIIVTGAGQGIGAAIARRAAVLDRPVCVNYRSSAAGAEQVVQDLREAGVEALAVKADVTEEDEVERLFATAVEKLGPLTAVVNNAGVTGGLGRVVDLDIRQLDTAYRAVLRSVVLCTREGLRHMSHSRGGSGGCVLNVSSTGARTGGGHEWVHYAALKAAVNTHTWGAAQEVAADGVRINAVAPGLIETGLHRANGVPDRPERLRTSVPMGRIGAPEEVAEAAVFLLSPSASYITGSVLEVGGGR
ncbi:MAG TPA: oxidoreductase [Streptomyces sp.]|uniref:SDR family oxidoreductase n=1 Tax=Streptomyces salyersiae TaxID=3075530 RepID=A0ABU2RQT7_9ACTN|nr:SDR family oxidoreductase [Streptomyces sp. DSM 41770]MDT0431198.1 SDR family oxidoreductase [Streptomyces sp. DSM 41770]HBF84993.1 oxidoreductase [Streptomyces sp.]